MITEVRFLLFLIQFYIHASALAGFERCNNIMTNILDEYIKTNERTVSK